MSSCRVVPVSPLGSVSKATRAFSASSVTPQSAMLLLFGGLIAVLLIIKHFKKRVAPGTIQAPYKRNHSNSGGLIFFRSLGSPCAFHLLRSRFFNSIHALMFHSMQNLRWERCQRRQTMM